MENEIAPWLSKLKNNLRPELSLIVKMGDLIDAILFISQEGIGKHAEIVRKGLEKAFEDKIHEAYQYVDKYNWSIAKNILEKLLRSEENQIEFEIE